MRFPSVVVLGLLAVGCQRREEVTVIHAEPAPAVRMAGAAEQPLDTDVGPRVVSPPTPKAPVQEDAPILTTSHFTSRVRTPQDEHLPRWVPVKGRLTVVDSHSLAENLGLVPPGATKSTEGRISVAEKLAETRPSDPIARGTSWNFSVKRGVRVRR